MIHSLSRMLTLGRITLLEAIRQRVLSIILLFGLALVASAGFFSGVVLYEEQIKFVKDWGLGFLDVISFIIAVLATAQLIPQELQNRTLYTILAKPVRRVEFLFGKFLGVIFLLGAAVSLMTLVFAVVLVWEGQAALAQINTTYQVTADWHPPDVIWQQYQVDITSVQRQVFDPQLVGAVLLLFVKAVLVAGIALLLSTFASSLYYTVVMSFLIYVAGNLEGLARDIALHSPQQGSLLHHYFLLLVALLIPDFNTYSIVNEIYAGTLVPWAYIGELIAYALVYLAVLLALSEVSFRYREI